MNNKLLSDEELELNLIELFSKATSLGFGMRLTKEEFAEAVKNGAIDNQEAAHEAMKIINQYTLSKQIEARLSEVRKLNVLWQGHGEAQKDPMYKLSDYMSQRIAELRKQQELR